LHPQWHGLRHSRTNDGCSVLEVCSQMSPAPSYQSHKVSKIKQEKQQKIQKHTDQFPQNTNPPRTRPTTSDQPPQPATLAAEHSTSALLSILSHRLIALGHLISNDISSRIVSYCILHYALMNHSNNKTQKHAKAMPKPSQKSHKNMQKRCQNHRRKASPQKHETMAPTSRKCNKNTTVLS